MLPLLRLSVSALLPQVVQSRNAPGKSLPPGAGRGRIFLPKLPGYSVSIFRVNKNLEAARRLNRG